VFLASIIVKKPKLVIILKMHLPVKTPPKRSANVIFAKYARFKQLHKQFCLILVVFEELKPVSLEIFESEITSFLVESPCSSLYFVQFIVIC